VPLSAPRKGPRGGSRSTPKLGLRWTKPHRIGPFHTSRLQWGRPTAFREGLEPNDNRQCRRRHDKLVSNPLATSGHQQAGLAWGLAHIIQRRAGSTKAPDNDEGAGVHGITFFFSLFLPKMVGPFRVRPFNFPWTGVLKRLEARKSRRHCLGKVPWHPGSSWCPWLFEYCCNCDSVSPATWNLFRRTETWVARTGDKNQGPSLPAEDFKSRDTQYLFLSVPGSHGMAGGDSSGVRHHRTP
jgi:hypothetical protein